MIDWNWSGLTKIISGGQVGIDLGALKAARAHNFPTGGTAPKGYRTTCGANYELRDIYGLVESGALSYSPRTKQNVLDSDGTLIIASNLSSPGTALTRRFCARYKKPVFEVEVPVDLVPRLAPAIANWLEREGIKVLNVAGNHERAEYHEKVAFDVVTAILVNRVKG